MMNPTVIIRDDTFFWTGNGWSEEYPDALIMRPWVAAHELDKASRTFAEGEMVAVANYGTDYDYQVSRRGQWADSEAPWPNTPT